MDSAIPCGRSKPSGNPKPSAWNDATHAEAMQSSGRMQQANFNWAEFLFRLFRE
jgi:hypothetical protein